MKNLSTQIFITNRVTSLALGECLNGFYRTCINNTTKPHCEFVFIIT